MQKILIVMAMSILVKQMSAVEFICTNEKLYPFNYQFKFNLMYLMTIKKNFQKKVSNIQNIDYLSSKCAVNAPKSSRKGYIFSLYLKINYFKFFFNLL